MTPRLTIIIPAFNEATRLPAGMERFDAAVAEGAVDVEDTEVVVIDDGSADATPTTARGLLAHLPHHRVVTCRPTGARGPHSAPGWPRPAPLVAYMDADMAIDPRAVPSLLDALDRSDAAIGSRALVDSMVDGTYAMRAVMGRLFNRLVTSGTGLGLQDTQCGFKAFSTPVARLLFHLVSIDRFAFDVELLSRAHRLGLRITEVPVQWRNVPGSTIHPLHDSLTMLTDVYRSRFGLLPTPPVPASWCVLGPDQPVGPRRSRPGRPDRQGGRPTHSTGHRCRWWGRPVGGHPAAAGGAGGGGGGPLGAAGRVRRLRRHPAVPDPRGPGRSRTSGRSAAGSIGPPGWPEQPGSTMTG